MNVFLKNESRPSDFLKWLSIVVISFGIVASLFIEPPQVEVTRQYFEFGIAQILFVIILFTALFNLKGYLGKGLSFLATLVLFSIPLLYKWQTSDYYSTLGGLLPLRDANAYYQGAQNLIYGFQLLETAAYRPIFVSFLSVVMKLTSGNLQTSLIVLVVLNAIAIYWATLEIQRTFENSLATALYLFLGYMFYRRFGGTLLTENMGFLLGNLSLIFLIRGSTRQSIKYLLYGLFLLTTGLNARAGAFLILPVLTLWLGFAFQNRLGFWRPFLYGFLVIILGMGSNWLLAKVVSQSSSSTFSNYSYTLYGLVVGNKGWEQAQVDHPELSTDELYHLSVQLIKQDPGLFARGVIGAYTDYFVPTKGAFSFLLLKHERNTIANYLLWISSFAALIIAFIKRNEMKHSIALAFFAGIMLSVGLVPPIDSTTMRVYAATIPMSIYIVAISATLPEHLLKKGRHSQNKSDETNLLIPILLSFGILLASFIFPILIKTIGTPPEPVANPECETGRIATTFAIANGSSINLVNKKDSTFIPNLQVLRLAGKLLHPEQQLTDDEKAMVLTLGSGTVISIARVAITNTSKEPSSISTFLITTGIPAPGIYTLCLEKQSGNFYALPSNGYDTIKTRHAPPHTTQYILRGLQWLVIILTFTIILIHSFEVTKFTSNKRLLAIANLLATSTGLILLLHLTGLIPLAWERVSLDSNKFQNRGDAMYAYFMDNNRISDTKYTDFPAYLYEDGVLLFHPHESQSLISAIGRGRYILRENFLYFSSSDNSNPETNGREYILEFPIRIRTRYLIAGISLLIIGLFFHFLYFRPMLYKKKST